MELWLPARDPHKIAPGNVQHSAGRGSWLRFHWQMVGWRLLAERWWPFFMLLLGWRLFSSSGLCSQHCWGFGFFVGVLLSSRSFFGFIPLQLQQSCSCSYIIINKSASGSESLSDHCFQHTPQITAGPVFTNQFFFLICFLLSLQLTEDFLLHGLTS